MQIIRTLLKTHNHASTPSLSFYRPFALPDKQPTARKNQQKKIPSVMSSSSFKNAVRIASSI